MTKRKNHRAYINFMAILGYVSLLATIFIYLFHPDLIGTRYLGVMLITSAILLLPAGICCYLKKQQTGRTVEDQALISVLRNGFQEHRELVKTLEEDAQRKQSLILWYEHARQDKLLDEKQIMLHKMAAQLAVIIAHHHVTFKNAHHVFMLLEVIKKSDKLWQALDVSDMTTRMGMLSTVAEKVHAYLYILKDDQVDRSPTDIMSYMTLRAKIINIASHPEKLI